MPDAGGILGGAASGATAGSVFGPWGTVIGGVVGAGSSLLSKNKDPRALPQNQYNMYGELNTPAAGAIASRDSIFNRLNSPQFQDQTMGAADFYAQALGHAAQDPGLASIYKYGNDALSGNFLNSPLVRGYADQAYNSQVAAGKDEAARTRSKFARAGMGFSTANQQATDADIAAATQRGATTRAGILSQNEQYERGLQQQAPGIISSAISQPLGYLSQVPGAYLNPLQQQAGLTTQLTGQNQIQTPTYLQQPTFNSQLAGGVQTGTGLASLYNSIFKGSKNSLAPLAASGGSGGGGGTSTYAGE